METTADVIEGRCGCGNCVRETGEACCWWNCQIKNAPFASHKAYVYEGCCSYCHYRLDADGFARRMVDLTIRKLRERIADTRAGNNMIQASHPEEREFAAVELERLLPSEEADNRE